MWGFYGYRRRMSRRALGRFLAFLLLAGLGALTVIAVIQMRSMLTRLATSRVSSTVNRIVTEAVNTAIDDGEFQYDRLISFEKDNDGKITAVKSNMPEFNRLQSAILKQVLQGISDVSTRDLSIPLGSLTGSDLLAGRGPLITVRMQSVGSSTAWLQNEFTSAGINQTKHQILLNVDVYVSILLPAFTTATKVSNSFTVAETVIVGSVPDSYTYFSSDTPVKNSAEDYVLNGN
jgi:sporulation protein YunB